MIQFTVIAGIIASYVFYFIYKRHINKNGIIKEGSLIINAPKIFGSINIILSLIFVIWRIVTISAFTKIEIIDTKVIIFSIISLVLRYLYLFYPILALPLSIGFVILSLLIRKNLNKLRFMYCFISNVIASIMLFIIMYLVSYDGIFYYAPKRF
jgi:hypothetical protein